MKSIPKVSVIMAVYNNEIFIKDSIESILNQTLKDFELIIINDCSRDNALSIINEYGKKNKKIIIINNKKNLGTAISRNKGLEIARGKYIAILDSDDISLKDRLEVQYKYLEQNKEIFLIGGDAINIDKKNNEISKKVVIYCEYKLKKALESNCQIINSTIMFRNTGKYYYRYKLDSVEDYDFYLNLLTQNRRIRNISHICAKYRIHLNSHTFSEKNRIKQLFLTDLVKKFYFERMKYGKDSYDKFDINTKANPQEELLNNKKNMKSLIRSSYIALDLTNVKKNCRLYFNVFGLNGKIIIYYFLSLLGTRLAKKVRKIMF